MEQKSSQKPLRPWQRKLHEIIFEADTPGGKAFDIALLISIILSVLAVMMESVEEVNDRFGNLLRGIEWTFTVLFTIEYLSRILCVRHPLKYIFSFFGLVDLLSIIPTYLSLFFTGTQTLLVIRTIRLLRVFRIFKLARYLGEASILILALKASRPKIIVFLGAVISLTIIIGTVMYLIEGKENGFSSIPTSIYWAIVTLTTVGYGDISPHTVPGQILASAIMIMGYGILAVPTGIVSVELAQVQKNQVTTIACESCGSEGHDIDATYCKNCGAKL